MSRPRVGLRATEDSPANDGVQAERGGDTARADLHAGDVGGARSSGSELVDEAHDPASGDVFRDDGRVSFRPFDFDLDVEEVSRVTLKGFADVDPGPDSNAA